MLRKFAAYYGRNRRLFIIDFSAAVVVGALELLFPVSVKLFIDSLLPTGDWSLIVQFSLLLLLFYVLTSGLTYVVNYWGHMLGINIETEMRRDSFDHLQKLSFAYFDKQKTGHLVARLTKDLEEIGEIAHHGPEDVFIALMELIGALTIMFLINAQMALLILLFAPPLIWFTVEYSIKLENNWQNILDRVAEFNARIEDNVGGIRVVQAFANEEHERALFSLSNEKYRSTKLQAYRYLATSASLYYFGSHLVQILTMIAGGYFVLSDQITTGEFIAFLLLVAVFVRPIEKVSTVLESYTKGIAGFRRFLEFLDTEPDVADRPHAKEMKPVQGHVSYRDVGFSYSRRSELLSNFNLDVSAGETIALVGASGAGKTTICSLLTRFYEVTSGGVSVDGVDIRDVTINSLRRNIGVVQQEAFLFAGSLYENIAYGNPSATESEVIEAAKRAKLFDFIMSLPNGFGTVVGDRGVKLSGGQKQRVSIARIFLKNPPILILDEATSSLDSLTEAEIQKSLSELAEGRTTFIIAHRLGTIKEATRIAVINNDGISELGSHEDLMARGGDYFRLYGSQLDNVDPSGV